MWNWLKSAYNGTVGALSTIEKWIVGALTAVYSYFDAITSQLWASLGWLGSELKKFYAEIISVLNTINDAINWLMDVGIPRLANWAQDELNKLRSYVSSVIDWASSQLDKLAGWVLGKLSDLGQWALTHIWDPLWSNIQAILKWIANEGTYVYDLLTHPEKLAALLGRYLLAAWISLGRTYAKPFVRWILHSAMSEASTVGAILEDIIASLF